MTIEDSSANTRPGEKNAALPARDASGEPVKVVKRDVQRPDPATDDVDKVITPTSIRSREQDAEKLQDQVERVEKKLDH